MLRGQGRFFDDLKLADQLHAAIVRSPHAHADITGIDLRAALQMPGVHAVLSGADYRSDGLGSLPLTSSSSRCSKRFAHSSFRSPRRMATRSSSDCHALRAGAARLGSGDLGQRIAIKTGDEVEALANQFNDMAGRLQESYTNLERKPDKPVSISIGAMLD